MLLIFRGHCHSPFSFQFSFWDSIRLSPPANSTLFIPFQFSFWDSKGHYSGTTNKSHSFNSLFEIRIAAQGVLNPVRCISFNSLFEILKALGPRVWKFLFLLSILFLRFISSSHMPIPSYRITFQFSFWDSLAEEMPDIFRKNDFQFSFWDS